MASSRRRPSTPGAITITGELFSEQVQRRPLAWDVPMRELLKNPEGGERAWKRLAYVFGLDDPRAFPDLQLTLTPEARQVCERFVVHARALACTTLLGAHDRMTVNIPTRGSRPIVETKLSAADVTTGFMAMFRQCFADTENACFSKVWKILSKPLNETGNVDAVEVSGAWRRAHADLAAYSLEDLVLKRLVAEQKMPRLANPDGTTRSPVTQPPASPRQLLQTVWYGGQIHWGKNRDALSAIATDPLQAGQWEITTRQVAVELTHFYLGFALLVEQAIGLTVRDSSEMRRMPLQPAP